MLDRPICGRLLSDKKEFLHAVQFLEFGCRETLKKILELGNIDQLDQESLLSGEASSSLAASVIKEIYVSSGHGGYGSVDSSHGSNDSQLFHGLDMDNAIKAASLIRDYRCIKSLDRFRHKLSLVCATASIISSIGNLMLWSALAGFQMFQVGINHSASFFPVLVEFFPLPFMLLSFIPAIFALIGSKVYMNNKRKLALAELSENALFLTTRVSEATLLDQCTAAFCKALGFMKVEDYKDHIKGYELFIKTLHMVPENLPDAERNKMRAKREILGQYRELQRFSDGYDRASGTAEVALSLFLLGAQAFWAISIASGFSKALKFHLAIGSIINLSAILDSVGIGCLLLLSISYFPYFIALNKKRKTLDKSIIEAAAEEDDHCRWLSIEGGTYKSATTQASKMELIKPVIMTCCFTSLLAGRLIVALEAAGKISIGNVVQNSSLGGLGHIPCGFILRLMPVFILIICLIHSIVTTTIGEGKDEEPPLMFTVTQTSVDETSKDPAVKPD